MAKDIFFTTHSLEQMAERDIDEAQVLSSIREPDQVLHSRERTVFHKLITIRGEERLLRVFLTETDDAYFVVTVYVTSKVSKYWRQA